MDEIPSLLQRGANRAFDLHAVFLWIKLATLRVFNKYNRDHMTTGPAADGLHTKDFRIFCGL